MKAKSKSLEPPPDSPRVSVVNHEDIAAERDYVLYWMIAARRPVYNFALDRAVEWSRRLDKPLLILEALRVDYPSASDRLHQFVIDGMAANARRFRTAPVLYFPYVEPRKDAGKGLLARLSRDATVVVTDDFPCFFLPEAVKAAGRQVSVRLEAIDSNGIMPIRSAGRAFTAAVHFRRYVQRQLREQLLSWPSAEPFKALRLPRLDQLPADVRRQWPAASRTLLDGASIALKRLPIDHSVPVSAMRGGWDIGRRALTRFVSRALPSYSDAHNHPDDRGTSRLSPYLHFGHVSTHEIFDAVMKRERWTARRLAPWASGRRDGWWNVSQGAEAFLDQLIVWRELALNTCAERPQTFDHYDSLPAWAVKTLGDHAGDQRPVIYSHRQLERAGTHDPIWNAAQRQLLREGWFHNYLRMLWGKKILEWSASPRDALATMTAIMNRWSLDGRDPNAYAGYFWTLGRYDRPWPERPVYGKVRSMSSRSTARKVRLRKYLQEFGR